MKAVKKKLWTGWIRIQKILTEKDGISTVELILVLVGNINPLLWGGYKVYRVKICG